MLIICPSCTTSYLIDPASVGSAGRTVRCARCKTTWFAGGPKPAPEVSTFVDSVIAEAEAQSAENHHPAETRSRPAEPAPARNEAAAADDFGHDPSEPTPALPNIETPSVPFVPSARIDDIAPHEENAPEPLTIADAPSLVPPIVHAPLPDAAEAEHDSEDVESFAARRARLKARRQQKRRSSRWTAIVLVLFAFNVALIGSRAEVVRYLPQTASLFAAIGLPVNLRNLKFEGVRISKDSEDGLTTLIIEGNIVSAADKPVEVPRLRFAARNASGQEVYTWTALAGRSILPPGASLEFSSRLVSPPADATDIVVRFLNSQDLIQDPVKESRKGPSAGKK
jgi:predicted Zn finger-like uncharacterized protein